jgi:hypothetical protein
MKRLMIVGLAAMGALALASGTSVRAADEESTKEKPTAVGRNFVDADGDGVCDNCTGVSRGQGQGRKARAGNRGHGPRDGSGNQVGPRDGSGRGRGSRGQCDGTGPKGRRQGRRGGGRR